MQHEALFSPSENHIVKRKITWITKLLPDLYAN
jgi:hypothetical protein